MLISFSKVLTFGFLLLWHSVVCAVESLSLFLFFSFVFVDLYVLGDDISIAQKSYMRTKQLCVLIHIRTKSEVFTIKHV